MYRMESQANEYDSTLKENIKKDKANRNEEVAKNVQEEKKVEPKVEQFNNETGYRCFREAEEVEENIEVQSIVQSAPPQQLRNVQEVLRVIESNYPDVFRAMTTDKVSPAAAKQLISKVIEVSYKHFR